MPSLCGTGVNFPCGSVERAGSEVYSRTARGAHHAIGRLSACAERESAIRMTSRRRRSRRGWSWSRLQRRLSRHPTGLFGRCSAPCCCSGFGCCGRARPRGSRRSQLPPVTAAIQSPGRLAAIPASIAISAKRQLSGEVVAVGRPHRSPHCQPLPHRGAGRRAGVAGPDGPAYARAGRRPGMQLRAGAEPGDLRRRRDGSSAGAIPDRRGARPGPRRPWSGVWKP